MDSLLDYQGALASYSFPRFAALLEACQDYASFSGGRFNLEAFEGIPTASQDGCLQEVGIERANDSGPLLAAKLRAAPLVRHFAERLLAGEMGLVEELERSSRICWTESTRNVMKATLTGLSMWPPPSRPEGVEEDDCSYEDVSAPLAAIAQRLYNDEHLSNSDGNGERAKQLRQRAKAAFFIVDFAEGISAPIPEMPETHRSMLDEFTERVKEWESTRKGETNHGANPHDARDTLRRLVANYDANHALRRTIASRMTLGSIRLSPIRVAVSGVAATGDLIARWAAKQQAQYKLDESELAPWAANWLSNAQVQPEHCQQSDAPSCTAN